MSRFPLPLPLPLPLPWPSFLVAVWRESNRMNHWKALKGDQEVLVLGFRMNNEVFIIPLFHLENYCYSIIPGNKNHFSIIPCEKMPIFQTNFGFRYTPNTKPIISLFQRKKISLCSFPCSSLSPDSFRTSFRERTKQKHPNLRGTDDILPSGYLQKKHNEATSSVSDQVHWLNSTQSPSAAWSECPLYLVLQPDGCNSADSCLAQNLWRQLTITTWRSLSGQRVLHGEMASDHFGPQHQFQRHFRGEFRRISSILRQQRCRDEWIKRKNQNPILCLDV